MGAWDSDPDNFVLSYKTPLAKSLLGKQLNNTVITKIGEAEETWEVLKIEKWVDLN